MMKALADLALASKAAGSVRDMDVLTAHALTLQADGEEDCVVHLLEHALRPYSLLRKDGECSQSWRTAIIE